jgi:MFS family permease
VFFGWKVVAVSFLVAVYAWGLGFYGPSVYVNELTLGRGWPVATVSAAVTFHFLSSAVLIALLADAHRRFGVVGVTRVGLIAFALGAAGWAWAAAPWQLFVAAALTGIGWSATSAAAINTFVTPWFDKKRGLALAQAYTGASIGGVAMTPLWIWTSNRLGFEWAAVVIAVGGMVLLWPLVGWALRATPALRGQSVDGAEPTVTPLHPHALREPPKTRRALLADPRFLSLSVAYAIGIFAQMGLITHLIVRLVPVLGEALAGLGLSLATACAILGRFGLVAIVRGARWRLAGSVNFLVQAIGTALLIFGETPLTLLAGCVLFGLGIGNLLSLPPLILQAEQPPQDVAQAVALMTSINQALYAFAPGLFGLIKQATGAYDLPFALALLMQLVSALCVLVGRRPPR